MYYKILFAFKFQSLNGCHGGKSEIKKENGVCSGEPDLGKYSGGVPLHDGSHTAAVHSGQGAMERAALLPIFMQGS